MSNATTNSTCGPMYVEESLEFPGVFRLEELGDLECSNWCVVSVLGEGSDVVECEVSRDYVVALHDLLDIRVIYKLDASASTERRCNECHLEDWRRGVHPVYRGFVSVSGWFRYRKAWDTRSGSVSGKKGRSTFCLNLRLEFVRASPWNVLMSSSYARSERGVRYARIHAIIRSRLVTGGWRGRVGSRQPVGILRLSIG